MTNIENKLSISVIIPVLNEDNRINRILNHVNKISKDYSYEIIVVDGDENNSTINNITEKNVIKVSAKKGRAIQMNRGAETAKGDILLFLHADTTLPENGFEHIVNTIETGKYVAGAFDLGFDNKKWGLKIVAFVASLRSRITRVPFGDQAFFINRDYFNEIGKFKNIPLMEDVEIMRRIKKRKDKIYIIPEKVKTSAGRWEKDGIIYTSVRNWILQILYYTGTSPEKLVRIYYKDF